MSRPPRSSGGWRVLLVVGSKLGYSLRGSTSGLPLAGVWARSCRLPLVSPSSGACSCAGIVLWTAESMAVWKLQSMVATLISTNTQGKHCHICLVIRVFNWQGTKGAFDQITKLHFRFYFHFIVLKMFESIYACLFFVWCFFLHFYMGYMGFCENVVAGLSWGGV